MSRVVFILCAYVFAAFACLLAMACRGETSKEPPVVPIRNMHDQPRYDPQERSEFYSDERTMRTLVKGVVAREMEDDPRLISGWNDDANQWVMQIPSAVIQEAGGLSKLTERGQERYGIYCAPCHAMSGNGNGMVSRRAGPGALAAPSLHTEKLRGIPDGQLYGTITNGIRNMPSYRHSIPLRDRWAITAYVRALQLSQLER